MDLSVVRGRREHGAVRAEAQRARGGPGAQEDADALAGGHVPDADGLVRRACQGGESAGKGGLRFRPGPVRADKEDRGIECGRGKLSVF